MYASFGAIHATIPGSVTVVEQFGRTCIQVSSFLGAEYERRYGCTVLSEIDNQILTRVKNYFIAIRVLAVDYYSAKFVIIGVFDITPYINSSGAKCKVLAKIYLSTIGRENLACEFSVYLGA